MRSVTLTSLSGILWHGQLEDPSSEDSLTTMRTIAARHFGVLLRFVHFVATDNSLEDPLVVTSYAENRPNESLRLAFRAWHDLMRVYPIDDSSDEEDYGLNLRYSEPARWD
jgi:hypothetical protein